MLIQPRSSLLPGFLVALLAVLVAALPAGAGPSASRLCAPLLPARAPLPTGIGLPPLAATSLPLSAHAVDHRALCRVGVYSPSDGARFNVNWYVFASHPLALEDLATLDPHTIYATVASIAPAPGFPKPSYLLRGTFDYLGRTEPIVTVTYVDGPALVSGSMLGGGTAVQAEALARWAERDIARIQSSR